MYYQRTPKSQQPDKNNFTLHRISDDIPTEWKENYYQIVSIDPGRKNLGLRIEQRYLDGRILPIVFEKVNITERTVKTGRIEETEQGNNEFLILTRYLDQYLQHFLNSHIFIIERQLSINYKAVRVSQHIISYFIIRMENSKLKPLILELDAKMKSKQLNAPPRLSAKEVKLWSIEKATFLLQQRRDNESLLILEKNKKKDDLADTVCQIEACCKLLKLPLTRERKIIRLEIPSQN